MFMVVWVDDINIAYGKECGAEYEAFRDKFRAEFKLNELGPVQDYLGMEISRRRDKYELSFNCSDNIKRILKQFEMEYCTAKRIPMASGVKIGPKVEQCDVVDKPYKSLVGSLLYPSQWC